MGSPKNYTIFKPQKTVAMDIVSRSSRVLASAIEVASTSSLYKTSDYWEVIFPTGKKPKTLHEAVYQDWARVGSDMIKAQNCVISGDRSNRV